MSERGLKCAVWSVIALTFMVVVVLVVYLCGWPHWCSDQLAAWGGIATALGALAMALTAWLILRQVALQAKTMEQIEEQVALQRDTLTQVRAQADVQDRQLKYYYLPALCLRVHYVQKDNTGVPVAFMTVSQAAVFNIEAWVENTHDQPRHMQETHPSHAGMFWDCGVIYGEQKWFARFGPLQQADSPQTIFVRWQQTVMAERWEQEWTLQSGNEGWSVTPHGGAHPVRE
jgi:hypothetical protein